MLENAPTKEVSITPGRLIKTDRIDLEAGSDRWSSRTASSFLILACAATVRGALEYLGKSTPELVEAHPWLYTLYDSVRNTSLVANGMETGLLAIPAVIFLLKGLRKSNLYYDDTLKVTAEPLVYKGKKPIQEGGGLKRGDNVLYVSLPRPQDGAQLTPQALSLYGSAARLALEGARRRFIALNYRAVVLDPNSFVTNTSLEGATRVPNSLFLSEKDINPARGESIIIPTDELDNLRFNTTDQLRAALDILKDPILNNYIALAQKAKSEAELQDIQRLINKYLRTSLYTHAMAHFSNPYLLRTDQPPFRKRNYDMVQHFTDSENRLILQIGSIDGGFYRRTIDVALGINEDVTVDKLDPNSPHYKAQLLYIIHELLRKNSFGDLVQEQESDPKAVAQKLAEIGFPIAQSADALKTVADTRKGLGLLKQIERAIIPIMVAAFLYTAGGPIERIVTNIDFPVRIQGSASPDLSFLKVTFGKTIEPTALPVTDISIRQNHRTTVPGVPPPHTVDWRVYGSGFNNQGYYTLETTHQMKNGEWVINQNRKRILNLPITLPKKEDGEINIPGGYIEISRWIEAPFVETYRFKLPVPENAQLSYLNIEDIKGLNYTVYELTDGTVEVEVKQDLFNFIPALDVKAYFTKTDAPQIKAVSPLPRIDESKIDEGNRRKIMETKAEAQEEEGFIQAITRKVRESHLYSITSKFIHRLNTLTSAEDLVNTVYEDSVCDCDTCTAQAALETTLGQTDDQFVNVAFGYLHGVLALEKRNRGYSSFLRGDTRHAYIITNRGTIVDPTPSVSNGDEETEKYLELLRQSTSGQNNDIDTFFDRNIALIDKRFSGSSPSDYLQVMRILGIIGAVSGMYVGSRFILNEERRRRTAQKVDRAKRRLSLSLLSREDLELAYTFFPWLSFGGETNMGEVHMSGLTKEEIWEKLKDNYTEEALAGYQQDQSGPERQTGIKGLSALKMRFIARLLQVV